MKIQFKHRINGIGFYMAIISLTIGTLLLAVYKIFEIDELPIIGFFYLLLSYAINSFTLLIVIISTLINFKDYQEHLITAVIMLLNIPISIWYIDITV